jgi:hypothetical protein
MGRQLSMSCVLSKSCQLSKSGGTLRSKAT